MLTCYSKKSIIAGCDEAGRGSLVGPVVAASVILPKDFNCNLINDSKLLSEKKRNNAYDIGSASYKIRDIYEDDSSDIRLKENITPFTEGLSFLNNLDVVTFSWNEKSPKHGEQETGLIAQNVKETLDNSNYQSQKLWYEGPDSYQGLDKKHLIPALVAAVQELSAKVKELEDKV